MKFWQRFFINYNLYIIRNFFIRRSGWSASRRQSSRSWYFSRLILEINLKFSVKSISIKWENIRNCLIFHLTFSRINFQPWLLTNASVAELELYIHRRLANLQFRLFFRLKLYPWRWSTSVVRWFMADYSFLWCQI